MLALPEGGEPVPAIVCCHDARGLDDFARSSVARLAEAGFGVLAADLHQRGDGPGETLPDRQVLGDLDGVVRYLKAQPGVRADRIAVVGFGAGATHAFLFACHSRDLDAAVMFHGPVTYPRLSAARPMQPLELALNLSCPLLAFYGDQDEELPAEQRDQMERVLSQFARDFDIVAYPGEGREFYRANAASDAWQRASSFLEEHLDV